MRLLIDYCTASTKNLTFMLILGIIFFIVSKALDNPQSNSVEICISGVGRVAGFVFLLLSLTTVAFMSKAYTVMEFSRYKQTCRIQAEEMMGGKENLTGISKEIKVLNKKVENIDLTDYSIDNVSKSVKKVNYMVVSLSDEEAEMLARID